MKPAWAPLRLQLRALQRRVTAALLRRGQQRRWLPILAGVSAADYLLPVLPNEGMAVTLGVLQPHRVHWIALGFALASAAGAGAMAWVLLHFADGAQALGLHTFGGDWQRITAYVQRYGPATLVLAAIFPSPPRAMVAATVLAGVAPALVMAAVLVGKLLLYGLVFSCMGWGLQRLRQQLRPLAQRHGLLRRVARWNRRVLAWRHHLSRIPATMEPRS
jgi:membrane protein YqaA with SNARE-associated domain